MEKFFYIASYYENFSGNRNHILKKAELLSQRHSADIYLQFLLSMN